MKRGLPKEYVPKNSRLLFVSQTIVGDYKKKVVAKAKYKCVCGNEIECFIQSVKRGKTLSCGCLNLQRLKERAKHGMYYHPAYRVWAKVKARCYNTNAKEYPNYGGRGVIMCDEWKDFPGTFVKWAIENGWERGLDIDKDIKASAIGELPLLYSPERCMFVTRKVNLNNTRRNNIVEFKGEKKTIAEWAEKIDINPSTLFGRLFRYKWPIERALSEVVNVECRSKSYIQSQ